jgi:hypothetical protein
MEYKYTMCYILCMYRVELPWQPVELLAHPGVLHLHHNQSKSPAMTPKSSKHTRNYVAGQHIHYEIATHFGEHSTDTAM